MPDALLWDVDGTLAETERDGHRAAFNAAFEAAGLPWRWSVERYGELLRVTGGFERILADLASQPEAPATPAEQASLARHLHALKNRHYAAYVEGGHVPLRAGVRELIEEASALRITLAIVTTTSRSNVDALVAATLGEEGLARFATVVCAEDAPQKKPHPEAYHVALERLGLSGPQTLAIEDSPAGVRAARAAEVPVIVTRSVYFADDPIDGALAVGPSLGSTEGWSRPCAASSRRVDWATLLAWHRGA